MFQTVKDIRQNLHAIRIQFIVTIKTTVANTKLGAIWWVLDPLILMLLYTFVVKLVFNRGGPDYHLFALCGIVTWQSFARSVNLCATALTRNSHLIKQANLPMHLYVLLPPMVQSFYFLIGLGIVAVWNIHVAGWHTAAVIFLILPMVLIPYTVGLFLSIFAVNMPDVGKIVPYILRFGFYMSPILYPPERIYELENIPLTFKWLYKLNPMVHVITATRDLLYTGHMFDWRIMTLMMVVTLVVMQMGLFYFRAVAPLIPKQL